jgi:hypothetical protein
MFAEHDETTPWIKPDLEHDETLPWQRLDDPACDTDCVSGTSAATRGASAGEAPNTHFSEEH